jgi:uncharacterized membrane-anchored protein
MNKKTTFLLFLAMSLIQLYVPASMIFQKENVLTSGTAFKFRTAPIDPNDPFRGKYIALNFSQNFIIMPKELDWQSGDPVYVTLTRDAEGYARIASVSKDKPVDEEDYMAASVQYIARDSQSTVYIQYPFDRFYMEETKAPLAEQAYNEAALDSAQVTYALVYVKKGEAVIQDVIINETPIHAFIKK